MELPYKVEYAKTGRSKCKNCKIGIPAGELRLAALVQVSQTIEFRHSVKLNELKCFFLYSSLLVFLSRRKGCSLVSFGLFLQKTSSGFYR